LSVPIHADEESTKRNTVQEVYAQIESDLTTAVAQLEGYGRPNREFVDQSVAQAFLADVYLEMGKYAEAAETANAARQGYALLSESDWKNGFYNIEQRSEEHTSELQSRE